MNVYDSERMADIMHPFGYEACESVDDADFVILNTCHIREKAAEKVYSELGRIKKMKDRKKKDDMLIAVAGCVGQAEGEEIFRRAPYVNLVVGPQSYQSLPDLVGKAVRSSGHFINLEMEDDKFDKLPEESIHKGISGILSIQEGCDKFCSFCVVPYTRGAEYSRNLPEIYREAIRLVSNGAKEITLLGQNVNAFHGKDDEGNIWNLGRLIKHLAKINGLERIRYSTSHPRDMHDDLYDAHASVPELMPFLNLPVQSGSDRILQAMNRKHKRDDYFRIIDKLKAARPDMQFSSDFIIGFPGETDQDFADTLDLAKRVNFTQAYSFKYSPRPGTPGAEMENQVPEDIKDERLQIFQAQINSQQIKFNEESVGKIMPVLFDRKGRKEGQLIGKTPYMQSVHVDDAGDIMHKIVDVNLVEARPNSLSGVIR